MFSLTWQETILRQRMKDKKNCICEGQLERQTKPLRCIATEPTETSGIMRNLDSIKGGHFVIVFIDSTEFLMHRIGLANTFL